jgi:hypothetical protein
MSQKYVLLFKNNDLFFYIFEIAETIGIKQ